MQEKQQTAADKLVDPTAGQALTTTQISRACLTRHTMLQRNRRSSFLVAAALLCALAAWAAPVHALATKHTFGGRRTTIACTTD